MNLTMERYLWDRIPPSGGWASIGAPYQFLPDVREVIGAMVASGMIASKKQALRTLEKWSSYYDYGVTIDLGWRVSGGHPPRLCRQLVSEEPNEPIHTT